MSLPLSSTIGPVSGAGARRKRINAPYVPTYLMLVYQVQHTYIPGTDTTVSSPRSPRCRQNSAVVSNTIASSSNLHTFNYNRWKQLRDGTQKAFLTIIFLQGYFFFALWSSQYHVCYFGCTTDGGSFLAEQTIPGNMHIPDDCKIITNHSFFHLKRAEWV